MSRKQNAETTSSSAFTRCHLLSLPPELRNRIYDLCFADPRTEADLLQTNPPSKALLLTCRHVYGEARLIHRSAYQDFWSMTKFTITIINIGARRPILDAIERLRDEDIKHIGSVIVSNRRRNGQTGVRNAATGVSATWKLKGSNEHPYHSRRWQELWFSGAKLEAMDVALLDLDTVIHGLTIDDWFCVGVDDLPFARIGELRRIIGNSGLTKKDVRVAVCEI